MEISRSTIYYKRKTPVFDEYEVDILRVYHKHNGNYGAPRIKVVLAKEGKQISKRRIGRILKKNCLESKHGRRKVAKNVHTAETERYIAENLIKGIVSTKSNEVCQADGSEFKYKDGKLIVAGAIDVYDKTVAVCFGERENKKLIEELITERFKIGVPEKFHSDRGSGNISLLVKEYLEKHNVKRSMSAPGSPNENQYIETFWKTAKTEIGDTRRLTKEELKKVIIYYVYYYNYERIHSSIGYMTPMEKRSAA